jgi:hypothetical protein
VTALSQHQPTGTDGVETGWGIPWSSRSRRESAEAYRGTPGRSGWATRELGGLLEGPSWRWSAGVDGHARERRSPAQPACSRQWPTPRRSRKERSDPGHLQLGIRPLIQGLVDLT